MKLLVTFPGKFGDSLWAMPTVRALAAEHGPVDLVMAPKYAGILDLYRQQPYIGRAEAWPSWQVQESAPMTPWSPFEETLHHQALDLDPAGYDRIVHLGYRTWPTAPLPQYVYALLCQLYPDIPVAPLSLTDPWIQVPHTPPHGVAVGFSDEWFELKYGLAVLLQRQQPDPLTSLAAQGSRWEREGGWEGVSWAAAIERVASARVVVACCSALHVLACAIGTPVIVVEPNPHRHNPIFWPLGMDGPEIICVKGMDGLPTFDARHCADTLKRILSEVSV